MKYVPIALILLTFMALTGCEPVDPYASVSNGDATIAVLQDQRERNILAITATAQAADKLQLSDARMATQHAADLSAAATERAWIATATADQADRVPPSPRKALRALPPPAC